MKFSKSEILFGLFCLVLVPLLAHWLYSPFGLNPTDDGFILAYSKRVLNGEIPHRDFISIRPALSAYLHLPEIAFGGKHTLSISRFIFWLQLGIICYLWAKILLPKQTHILIKAASYLLAYMLISHNYPPMAWHTIDGLFLSTLGVFFCSKQHKWILLGAILLGLSALCKQNFLLIGPFAILMFRPKFKLLLAWLFPILIYISFISVNGGFGEMIEQFKSETSLIDYGFMSYIKSKWLYVGIVLAVFANWLSRRKQIAEFVPLLLLTAVIGISALSLQKGQFFYGPAFLLFGLSLILVFNTKAQFLKSNITGLFLAWSASVSVGLNSPVLLICVSIFILFQTIISTKLITKLIVIICVLSLLPFYHLGRIHHIYRDLNSSRLSYQIGDVLPKATGILTNKRVYDFHKEIKVIADTCDIVLLPYSGMFWALSNKRNKSLIHWTSNIELQNDHTRQRFIEQIENQRGKLTILIPKFNIPLLAQGRKPMEYDEKYPVTQHFKKDWNKTNETIYFFIYR